ncbi:MAG: futalosine hydrolase [Pirellulales bacterium]
MSTRTHMILVPTQREISGVRKFMTSPRHVDVSIELCGFGAIAAAARAAQLVCVRKPSAVTLVGIAGSLGDKLEMAKAYCFRQVICYGIGVGTGANFEGAASLGWLQWAGNHPPDCPTIADRIGDIRDATSKTLLTVCAASKNNHDVAERQQRYPDASAEDMEGFGVALACEMAGVPWQIIRGISNQAGQRDHSQWCIEEALKAASILTLKSLREEL